MSIEGCIVFEDLAFHAIYESLGYTRGSLQSIDDISLPSCQTFTKSLPSAWITFSNAHNIEGDNIKALMTLEIIIIIFGKKYNWFSLDR